MGLHKSGSKTCAEAIEFFEERKAISNEKQACLKLLEVNTEILPSVVKGDSSKSVLFDGCRLAKSLLYLETQKKWELISNLSCTDTDTDTDTDTTRTRTRGYGNF